MRLKTRTRISEEYRWSEHVRILAQRNRELLLRMPRTLDPKLLPPDFDPQLYWALHPDVTAAGMDAIHHYLTFGHREGRRVR
jgi:hypothetical protein